METVGIAVLKQQLSNYLHRVEAGAEFVVTSHRRVVAHVTPPSARELHVRPPSARISTLVRLRGISPSVGRASVDLLREDRALR